MNNVFIFNYSFTIKLNIFKAFNKEAYSSYMLTYINFQLPSMCHMKNCIIQ